MPDITPPTVSMRTSVTHFATVGFTGYSNAIYITLSEPSTDFNSLDLTVVNGGVFWFTGSGTEYKAYIYIGSASNTSVSIANGKFSDAAGNFNTDGADSDNTISFTYQDVAPPYLYFANSLDYKSVDVGNSITLNITLSESSTNFDLSDINVTGGQLSNFLSVTPRSYRVTFTASDATVNLATLSVAEGAFSDAAGNFNTYRSTGTNLYKKSISIIHNHLAGSSGSETISGTQRSDQITTFNGNDVVYAGEGSDVINGLPSTLSPDVYTGTLIAYGGLGNDFIFGKTGDDTLYGEDGNDVLEGGDGRDVLYGGNGNDVLSETDQLTNFLYGEAGDDSLVGTGFLYGGSGNDQLTGGNIADHLEGGSGDDRIYGGDGVDAAIYAGLFSKFSVTVLYEGKEGAFSGYSVLDKSGSEGVDWINTDVEFLSFYNGKTIVTLNNGSISSITLNSNPTGSVKIVGYLGVGSIINVTNTLSDEDGIGPIKYQWLASLDGEKWLELGTGTTLPVGLNAAGNLLKVNATYTDFNGTIESVSSEQTIRIPDQIRRQSNNISLIVDKGVLGENAVLLNDLLEVKVWKNNRLVSQTIDYQNITYNFRDFELVSSIVIRNGDFTDDFKFEIDNYLQRNANLSLSTAIEIVGSLNFDQILLKIAGSDGNFVG